MKGGFIIQKLLKLLRARESVGGLEISDVALHYAYFDGKKWQLVSRRMPYGILEDGVVKNKKEFVDALIALRKEIFGGRRTKRPVNVVASLGSSHIYSQVFSLPTIKGENLEKAVELNLQMASPSELSASNSSWQVVFDDVGNSKKEILAAFIDRKIAEDINIYLREAGFLAVAFEWRSLGLVRLMREQAVGFDKNKTYVILDVGVSGLDFLVSRHGQLYFEYFVPWKDIYGDEREIPVSLFKSAVVRHLRQVLNFYNQHWQDKFEGIFFTAGGLSEDVGKTVQENFSLTPQELHLNVKEQVSPEWFGVLGSGFRALLPRNKDMEINLLEKDAQGEFRRQHVIYFFKFWRILIPASLLLLGAAFGGAEFFLTELQGSLSKNPVFQINQGDLAVIAELQGKVGEFNRTVRAIRSVQGQLQQKNGVVASIESMAALNNIRVTRVSFSGFGKQTEFEGEAVAESDIIKFKEVLEKNPDYDQINFSFQNIQTRPTGIFFRISFSVKRPIES